MRRIVSVAVILLWTSMPAIAGVIVTQEESNPDGQGGTRKETKTIEIEGTKQKISGGADGMIQIIDADAGTMTNLDPKTRTATQMNMTGMGAMMSAFAAQGQFEMKPTGGKKTVAGYSCSEYEGGGKVMMSEMSIVQCVSKDVPGAADYAAFGKRMMEKMGAPAPTGQPEGIVLHAETTTRSQAFAGMPGMPPEVLKQLAEEQAKAGPQVSRIEVKSIRTGSIPPAAFEIPAGYTKQDMGDFMKQMQGGE